MDFHDSGIAAPRYAPSYADSGLRKNKEGSGACERPPPRRPARVFGSSRRQPDLRVTASETDSIFSSRNGRCYGIAILRLQYRNLRFRRWAEPPAVTDWFRTAVPMEVWESMSPATTSRAQETGAEPDSEPDLADVERDGRTARRTTKGARQKGPQRPPVADRASADLLQCSRVAHLQSLPAPTTTTTASCPIARGRPVQAYPLGPKIIP